MAYYWTIAQSFAEKYSFFIILACVLAILILFTWNIVLHVKINRREKPTVSGEKPANLDEILENHDKTLKLLDKDIQELYNISNQINALAFRGLHKFGMIRFNPFNDVGGDQSFAIAFLNGKDNGLVISSLYTREGTRVYSKSIVNGESEKYPLTDEEKQAINIAKAQKMKTV
jgi:hypothetical protein